MKKILFLQSFSLTQPGGGSSIIKKLLSYAKDYNVETIIACDEQELPEAFVESSKISGEYHLRRRITSIRYGVGIILRFLLLFSIDFKGRKSLRTLFTRINPDIIHITIHGIAAPLYVYAAKKWGKAKVYISIHDYWPIICYVRTPTWITNYVFRRILFSADGVFVISEEMGLFLKEKYAISHYEIIHDGYSNIQDDTKAHEDKPFDFLYVGLLHEMQLATLQHFVAALSKIEHKQFVLGVCSNYSFNIPSENVTIKNYGWLKETELKLIAKQFKYGILPVSFEEKDSLFYKTSLMTKIPFYISNALPIIYIGPKYTASYNLIIKDKLGKTIVENTLACYRNELFSLVENSALDYEQLLNNHKLSIESTFNIERISKLFYSIMLNE